MSLQVISSGPTVASKYGSFGFANQRMVPNPSRMFGLVVGRGNAGKSSFLLSNPGTLLLNLDLTSTPVHSPNAPLLPGQIWPGVDVDGNSLGLDGKPILPTWAMVEEVKVKLIEASKNNLPRPTTIGIDSISSAIRWLKPWVLAKMGKTDWSEIDGRKGWDTIYDKFVDFAMELRQAGYGVWYTAHLVDTVIPIGENISAQQIDINMSDKLYRRLYPLFEMVVGVEKRREQVMRKVDVALPGGKSITREVAEIEEQRFLVLNHVSLDRILKGRVKMPTEIKLPEAGSWKLFEDKFIECATSTGSPS